MIILTHGDSMLPTMKKLGIAFVKKTNNYCLGDIILLNAKNGKQYLHRVVKLENFKVTTKGDNRDKGEEYETDVDLKNIKGKVIWWMP